MKICVFGAASDSIEQKYIDLGYELGVEIVRQGHSLVFGGGKFGMMGAVARGVDAENGEKIAVYPKWMSNFHDVYKNNTLTVITEGMDDRKKNFLKYSDVFLVTPGGIGTLDEFFEVITLKKLKVFEGPIIIFNMFNFYDKMFEMLDEMIGGNFLNDQFYNLIKVTSSIEETFDCF